MPRANALTTCMEMAWSMEAAMSSFDTLRLIRFCTSVFEKTPQREAMG